MVKPLKNRPTSGKSGDTYIGNKILPARDKHNILIRHSFVLRVLSTNLDTIGGKNKDGT